MILGLNEPSWNLSHLTISVKLYEGIMTTITRSIIDVTPSLSEPTQMAFEKTIIKGQEHHSVH